MKRYWFEFDLSKYNNPPIGVLMGCGITASSLEEAIDILKTKVFINRALPDITRQTIDIDIATLDQNHVVVNMGNPIAKGVWFPLGYDSH